MAKPRGPGMSGFAIAMIGAGTLAVYSAIKGTTPLVELRSILTGKRPDPLSKTSKGTAIDIGAKMETGTYQGAGGKGGKLTSTGGVKPHVLAEMHYIADTWKVETQGFSFRNIAGTNTLSDHARGLALDAMVPSGVQGQNIGDAIFNHYIQNASAKHVHYVIWRHTIWSTDRGAHNYAKSDHMNHVHISFFPLTARGAS